MLSGRGKSLLAAGVFALAIALAPVVLAAAPPPAQPFAKQRTKLVFLKGRVLSDGYVTPGQLETIAVSNFPPRTRLKVFIEAPPTTPQCGELYFCDPAPTSPAPNTPPYRSSGGGRALLSFVMPSTYDIETDPLRPSQKQPVTFANNQRVHIDVEGIRTQKRAKKIAFGFSRAIVQTTSSP
ncbi:MAG: hypothetical protein ACJ75Z_12120 [Solirubrobacterales bacterium]